MKAKNIFIPGVAYGATLTIIFFNEYQSTGSVNQSIEFIILVVLSTLAMVAIIIIIILLIFYFIWKQQK